jgi:hypothetical protein
VDPDRDRCGRRDDRAQPVVAMMGLVFKVRSGLRNRRWRKYWAEQEERNHVEFYRKLAAEWRAERLDPTYVGMYD